MLRRAFFILALIVGLSSVAAAEDTVTLEGGNVVQGKIESVSETSVTILIKADNGGTSRVTLPRTRVRKIEYDKTREGGESTQPVGPSPVREDWFLLRSDGRIVGTRRLALWGSGDKTESGWRLEEELEYFAQGPHVPSLSVRRVEETDLRFVLRRSLYREDSRQALAPGGPEAYMRSVTGRVEGGMWKGRTSDGRVHNKLEVLLPSETRGPLGHREHILRKTREVGLDETHVLDGRVGELVAVRVGFVGLQQRARTAPGTTPADPRDELHWESRGTRLISWFGQATRVVKETIAEGVSAMPVTRAQAEAAQQNATKRAKDPKKRRVQIAEAGIEFSLPDPSWTWQPEKAAPMERSWRKLGVVDAPLYTATVRAELHDDAGRTAAGMAAGAAWLKERLLGVCKDLRLAQKAQPPEGVAGGWRVGYTGTLRGQAIYTLAVAVDRGASRTLLLIACPKAAWEEARPALERFIASVNLL